METFGALLSFIHIVYFHGIMGSDIGWNKGPRDYFIIIYHIYSGKKACTEYKINMI